MRTAILLALLGCAPPPAAVVEGCRILGSPVALPASIRETSGLALSRGDSATLWTHNDSGNDPVLFALDSLGAFIRQVTVTGATVVDWEDIAAGPCEAGSCLMIGDIGDNAGQRDSISIYVVPEPGPSDSATAPAVVFHTRYPDRPQDAEALFVLPTGDIYVVTKGRRDSIALYRYPKSEQHPGGTTRLERVRALAPRPSSSGGRVTGASASPDGRFVAIRTYEALYIYETASLIGNQPTTAAVFNLRRLNERQGEAVALGDNGDVRLSTEAEGNGYPLFSRLKCDLPEAAAAAGSGPGAQALNP
jgi:hypothetical protein